MIIIVTETSGVHSLLYVHIETGTGRDGELGLCAESCVKVEVAALGSLSLIVRTVSM